MEGDCNFKLESHNVGITEKLTFEEKLEWLAEEPCMYLSVPDRTASVNVLKQCDPETRKPV